MKEYSLQINQITVRVIMSAVPDIEEGEVKIWGFPYANTNIFFKEDLENGLDSVKGHFFVLKTESKVITLACDIVANYRIYYIEKDNELIFSDDYNILIKELKSEHNLSLDEEQFAYWKKHRFTLGDSTLFHQIKKIPPAHIFEISDEGVKKKCYYKLYLRTENYNKLLSDNYQDLLDSIKSAYECYSGNKVLLLFSGGTDSTLLAYILKELHIPFTAVVFKFTPLWHDNLNDVCRAKKVAERIGIKNIEVLEVDFSIAVNSVDKILDFMLFDRHISVHFFMAYKKMSERFGTDILLINGQSSDSILSFGPSDCTIGSFIRRMVLYSNRFIKYCLLPIINLKFGNILTVPNSRYENFTSFLDETNYYYLKDKRTLYENMLRKKVDLIQSLFPLLVTSDSMKINRLQIEKYEDAFFMYLKIFSFIQGPDNLIVIKGSEYNGIKNVVMPFTSPRFIYNVVRYKSNNKELLYPKYFVRDILRSKFKYFSYYNQYKDVTDTDFLDFDINSFTSDINCLFIDKMNTIIEE